jgi:hypothetical protein
MNKNMTLLLSLLRNGNNPQAIAMQLLQQQAGNNPMLQNLLQLAQQGDSEGIEAVVRNIAKERGIDFDKELNEFQRALGIH